MKFESAAVYVGEEVLSEPGNENCQRAEAAREERDQENPSVMERSLQQSAITPTESLEGRFEALLNSHEWIADRSISSLVFIAPQQILRHSRDDRPGQKIGSQHGENHCFGE